METKFDELNISDNNFNTTYYASSKTEYYNNFINGFFVWVPFDRFTDIKEIGEGGFEKVFLATWIDDFGIGLILSKYFHIGNILRVNNDIESRVSDFELSGPANEKASDDKVYGLIPYSIAPEVLTADIYSLGVAMAELSYGKPLTLVICNAPIL
ncbi:kinase-like domain-containing protein [Rhizophagus clarus]|uniref:Kinase-like domain-containing protein n=1 Tax=Rhizophagus clarus TaxID=94130 RepID=A0A8H3KRW4_9GLOM|nr:kinase-like domain-containing protein [Rhizophagus clarus]